MTPTTNYRDAKSLANEILTPLLGRYPDRKNESDMALHASILYGAFQALECVRQASAPLTFMATSRRSFYRAANDVARSMRQQMADGLKINNAAAYQFFYKEYSSNPSDTDRYVLSRICQALEAQPNHFEQPRKPPTADAKLKIMGFFGTSTRTRFTIDPA